MKRTLAIIAALGMSTAVSGCFLSSNDEKTAAETQTQSGPAWKVTLQSKCDNGSTENCVAAYGFSVSADGTYQAGPAPSGQVVAGTLSEEEFRLIASRVAALSSASASETSPEETAPAPAEPAPAEPAPAEPAPPAPAPVDPAPAPAPAPGEGLRFTVAQACTARTTDSEDTLTITTEGQDRVIARAEESELCFQTANVEAAAALHDAIRTLAVKYYGLPFPDQCANSLAVLNSLYASVQSCASDADCAYIDERFDVIPPSGAQFVTTDTCTLAKPLVVANFNAVQAQKASLAQALGEALAACGETPNVCGQANTGAAAPSCQQGVCRVPSASLR